MVDPGSPEATPKDVGCRLGETKALQLLQGARQLVHIFLKLTMDKGGSANRGTEEAEARGPRDPRDTTEGSWQPLRRGLGTSTP